ncbi:MAG: ABC transporter permease [Chloroflexi bacterium]|nr:ABC transporter permease [Chloroflexota bacterium]
MEELFGLPTIRLMWIVVAIAGVAAAVVAFIFFKRPILVRMGLRNIPRRRAQTVLVTMGLTLATIIVTTAFSTGDSLSTSIRALALEGLVRIDHLIEVEEYAQAVEEGVGGVPEHVLEDLRRHVAAEPELSPSVDAVFGAAIEPAVASNDEAGQLEPQFNVVGVDASVVDRLGAVLDESGEPLELGRLAVDQIVINELAARELAAEAGDTIELTVRNQQRSFRVAAIAQNATLTGDGENERIAGGVLGIDVFRGLFAGIHEPGVWDIGAVAATGGIEGGLLTSEMLDAALQEFLETQQQRDPGRYLITGLPLYSTEPVKADALEFADLFASLFTTLFLFMGSFSVVAGILLVFLIFAMLAEERKPEMGIARAVGMHRGQLIQTFIAEGMIYNVGAAAVGVVLGILIALGMIAVLNSLVSSFGFSLSWSITIKSIVISAGLGLVITFVTVVFSSFRASHLNIVAAIRDLPDERYEEPLPWTRARLLRNVAGLFTTPLGLLLIPTTLVTLPLFMIPALLLERSGRRGLRSTAPRLILPAWRLMQWNPQWWATFIVGGYAIMQAVGLNDNNLFTYMLGVSLIPLGIVMGLVRLPRLPSRPLYTLGAAVLLLLWFIPNGWHEDFWNTTLNGGPELFVLAGAMLTAGGTLLLVFNLDLLVGVIRRVGGVSGKLAPIVQTAAAYPASTRYRTGLTIAMIALITFALVNFTTINASFQDAFTTDDALGGYEVIVIDTDATNLGDLREALEAAGANDVLAEIDESGAIEVGPTQGTPVRAIEWEEWDSFAQTPLLDGSGAPIISRPMSDVIAPEDREYAIVGGIDVGFVNGQQIGFLARSRFYDSDEAVWAALGSGAPVAVATAEALGDGFSGFGAGNDPWSMPGNVTEDSTILPRTTIEIGVGDASVQVELIAVISLTVGAVRLAGDDSVLPSLLVPANQVVRAISDPLYTRHFVSVVDGVDSIDVAQGIERTLRVETVDVQGELEDQQAFQSGFLALFQAFIGIGLVAGLAALGVIAVRAVVERRQQIGMMRAIGFHSRMVGLELLLEMGFIALLGLLLGTALALGMAYRLFAEGTFGDDVSMVVPVGTILPILFGALAASLVLTFIPARQAARTTIAEALRYE